MTSTKIKRTLSKFYGSGDETTEEIDEKSFDRLLVDDKHLVSTNSSAKNCNLSTKNKMKSKTNINLDISVMNTKPFKEDVIDGFSIFSFSTFDDLEEFVKSSKGRSSTFRENRLNFYDQKVKRNNTSSPQVIRNSIPVKTPETHLQISKHEADESSSDATVEENVEDRTVDGFLDGMGGGGMGVNMESEVFKVAVKRPPEELKEQIESKRALWDNGDMKPNFEGLFLSSSQNVGAISEPHQTKSNLKREVLEDDDALIEGVTKKEGNSSCNLRNDIKPIIKSDSELDPSNPTFSGSIPGVEAKIEKISIKKEVTSKRRSPTPDDVVVVLDDSSSHSGGTSWVRCYAGLTFGDGKALRNDSVLLGCARTDIRYNASRIKNKHKNFPGDKKSCSSGSRKTSSIGLSSSISSKAGFSPRQRGRVDSPRMSDRLPPFRPPAFIPPRLTPPIHATGGFCLPMPTVVPPSGLGVTLPQQPSMMMPGWGQFELLAAQMAANQEMLRVQQGLNDRFLQDGSGSLRTVPLLGTGINIPMAIPGLQPTLTLRTEMHQHQHLHHHQHVVPALPYAPLPTVPPPVHPIQTQMAPPMYFQPSSNIFSSSIHTRPGLPTRGAFMPMADHRSNSLPASQLLAKFRDRDWKQSNGTSRAGFKGKWCSAHVQLAWRILMHCRGMKQQAEDSSYGSKFTNTKINEQSVAFKPSTGRIGSPPPLRQSWMNNPLTMKSERMGQEAADIRMMEFARKERDTVLRINSGRGQVDEYPYAHLNPHFLHQSPINAFNEKKEFLNLDGGGMGPFNRGIASNESSFYNKGSSLNPFSSTLPPFLPLGDDLLRGQQERKLMSDKYSTNMNKDTRLSSPDPHHRIRTSSNSSLNNFPFFPPPPPGPNSSIQPNLHLTNFQNQRYCVSAIKPSAKQDLAMGFPNFHGSFNKPYPATELMAGGLLPQMLDPSRRSPFLKHPDHGGLGSSTHPHMWNSYPPGIYPPSAPNKSQDGGQSKGSMCLPVPPVPPLLPPYR